MRQTNAHVEHVDFLDVRCQCAVMGGCVAARFLVCRLIQRRVAGREGVFDGYHLRGGALP
jgi:hypothetical protein